MSRLRFYFAVALLSLSSVGKAVTYITTWAELDAMPSSGDVVLLNNLSSGTAGYAGIGDSWTPTAFSGAFDGRGHSISDLVVTPTGSYLGFFGYITSGASVSNLMIINASMSGDATYCGGIAGAVAFSGNTIENCAVLGGTISHPASYTAFIGGLIGGHNTSGGSASIKNSYASIAVSTGASGTGSRIGGLIGDGSQCTINNCFSVGNVSSAGTHWEGGFAGSSGSFSNCGWANTAGNPSQAAWSDYSTTVTLTYEESSGTPFFSSSHNVYDTASPVWDFVGTWYEVGWTYPFFQPFITITIDPSDQVVSETNSATFSVTAYSDGGILFYQWATNGVEASGETNSTFSVAPTYRYLHDGMLVSCVLDNTWNSESVSALLTVNAEVVTITDQPDDSTVFISDTAVFSGAGSGPFGVTYQWLTNGVIFTDETNSSVSFPGVAADDDGLEFRFIATGAAQSATSDVAVLSVTPYMQISSWQTLQNVTNFLARNYKLMSDLSSRTSDYSGIGDNFTPIGHSFADYFSGSFDGDGHVISDMIISNTARYNGLFGHVVSGSVVNVGIENCSIFSWSYAGALVGKLTASVISNCYSTGSLTGAYQGGTLGGLIGSVNGTNNIFNSYSMVDVLSNYGYYHGGFSGNLASDVTIKNCYAGGNVSGDSQEYDGGFTGLGFIPTSPINCGWVNHAGNPAVAEDGCMTNSFTYEITNAVDLYSASHPIYTNTTPVWDFSSLWIANATDYPTFGHHQGTWLIIAGVSRTNCFSITGVVTTNILDLAGVL